MFGWGVSRSEEMSSLSKAIDELKAKGHSGGDALMGPASDFHSTMRRALADPAFLPAGGTVGIYCRGTYLEKHLRHADAALMAGCTRVLASQLGATLENDDAVLAALLASTGLQVKVARLLATDLEHYDFDLLTALPTAAAARLGSKRSIHGLKGKHSCCTRGDVAALTPLGPLTATYGRVEWLGRHCPTDDVWASTYVMDPDYEYADDERKPVEARFYELKTSTVLVAVVPAALLRGPLLLGPGGGAAPPGAVLLPAQLWFEVPVPEPAAERAKRVAEEAAEAVLDGGAAKRQRALPHGGTAATRLAAALNAHRIIHVVGGQGEKVGAGPCSVTLGPGEGLRELKVAIRKQCGRVQHHVLGQLALVDAQGVAGAVAAKAKDLVGGATVQCTYTVSLGGTFGGGGGGGGGGGAKKAKAGGRSRGGGGFPRGGHYDGGWFDVDMW